MLDKLLPMDSVWQNVAFFLGIGVFVVALFAGLMWLSRGSVDNTATELREIKRELEHVRTLLEKRDDKRESEGKDE